MGLLYFEFKASEKHEMERSLGFFIYQTLRRSWFVRHVSFVIGLALTTIMVWLPMAEYEKFDQITWPGWANALYNAFS